MSSLKMTFSLASLILLMAFVAMPVMAHMTDAYDVNHDGKLNSDTDVADLTELDHTHLAAPTVTSIALVNVKTKATDAATTGTVPTVKGSSVLLTDGMEVASLTDLTESTPGEFQVKITFSGPVYGEATSDALGELVGTDLTVTAASQAAANANLFGGGVTVGDVTRMVDDAKTKDVNENLNTFLVTITVANSLFGNATADPVEPSDLPIDVWITVDANSLYIRDGGLVDGVVRFGRGNAKSSTVKSTVVATFEAAATAPTATITAGEPDKTTGKVVFTIKFNEVVVGFSLGDITVENGTKDDFATATEANTYTLTVTPASATAKVTVTIAAASATSTNAAKTPNAKSIGTYVPKGYTPTVTITPADGASTDAGKIVFTFDFGEALAVGAFTIGDITVTNGQLLKNADFMEVIPTAPAKLPAGVVERYTLRVTPADASKPVTVTLNPGAVAIANDPKVFIDSEQVLHTLTAGTPPPTTETPTTDDPTVSLTLPSIPTGGYVIITHSAGTTEAPLPGSEGLPAGVTTVAWDTMLDLEDLFFQGGTLTLTHATGKFDHDGDGAAADADAKTAPIDYGTRHLIITEVMAALNNAETGKPAELSHQWIEVHNPLKVAVGGGILRAKLGRPALSAGTGEVLLDRLSNEVGGGWTFDNLGQNGFDDGLDTTSDTNFVSFYRKERGKDGHTKGHWATSTATYLTGHVGTPGTIERTVVATVGTTAFDVGAIIFNEVSNKTAGDYEWIELRNKSDATFNLKNRRISIVTAVGTDTWLYDFGNKDLNVAAGGILLLTFSDPSDNEAHPLAAGWNVEKGAADQVNGVNDKSSPRYLILVDSADAKRKRNEDALDDDAGLPNDGEFVLVLRSRAHGGDVGKDTNIIDIAGYHKALTVPAEQTGFTNLWPLKGGVRHANRDKNKFEVDKVHRRQKDNIWGTNSTTNDAGGNHVDHTAFRDVGWTGTGYKRNAASGDANGGTPGYDNGVQKSADAAALDPIVISEIMFDSSRNLPQWIEIQNTSNTVGVNLTNWAVDIINHGEDSAGAEFKDAPLSTRIKIWEKDSPDGAFQVPPGQTVLIVSNAGRDETNLPAGRIINLRLGRGNKLLNPNGFSITLIAKANEAAAKHQTGDVATNLVPLASLNSRRADAQSFAVTAWDLPSGTVDGDRVSIARRTSPKVTATGTEAAGWVSSDMDTRLNQMRDVTYYGHSDDVGSPGHTVGGVLPVSLSKFRPERLKDTGEIVVRWITESELNNAGFNILRSETRDGEFTKLNTKLIAGQGTTSERNVYVFPDTSAKPNVVYYYQIQDVSLDGQVQTLRTTHLRGNVTAAGKLTTIWGEIKALQ